MHRAGGPETKRRLDSGNKCTTSNLNETKCLYGETNMCEKHIGSNVTYALMYLNQR